MGVHPSLLRRLAEDILAPLAGSGTEVEDLRY